MHQENHCQLILNLLLQSIFEYKLMIYYASKGIIYTIFSTHYYLIMKTIQLLICIFSIITPTLFQNINLFSPQTNISMASNGIRSSQFYRITKQMDCGMPQLYVYADSTHAAYTIQSQQCLIQSVESIWQPITYNLTCDSNISCIITINNDCKKSGHQINWIKLNTSLGELEYLVNCNPQVFHKPFQWGLLLLIMLTTLVLTLSSLYSRAWSYGGVGYQITNKSIIFFNLFIFAIMIFGFFAPTILSFVARVAGSIAGALGVGVCISQFIYLSHNKNYLKKFYKFIRIIDVISYGIGLLFIPLYWLLNGQWIVNDIMAVCSTVALMKLLKIKSLSIAVNLLASLLVVQIIVGVVVHYVLKISYNNYIINLFQNPVMLVMPSITRELYRQCAWLPISAALFPGLVLSYLRRFDKSRGTYVYFLIGLGSFYFGSICWMVIDLQTIHSLPFAIISEPITIIIVVLHSFRRNEFKTLWKGSFHDEQLNENQILIIHKETEIIGSPTAYADLTDNLRVSANSSSNYQAISFSQQIKL